MFRLRLANVFKSSLLNLGAIKNNTGSWDRRQAFAVRCQNGLTIFPSTNLIETIGWGNDATHVKKPWKEAQIKSPT